MCLAGGGGGWRRQSVPRKNAGHWVPSKPPRLATYHVLFQLAKLLGEFSMSYVTLLGEDPWKFVPGFLHTLSHVPFPVADFAVDPSAVIYHNHKCNSMLSPLSPHQTWRPTTQWLWYFFFLVVLGIEPKALGLSYTLEPFFSFYFEAESHKVN